MDLFKKNFFTLLTVSRNRFASKSITETTKWLKKCHINVTFFKKYHLFKKYWILFERHVFSVYELLYLNMNYCIFHAGADAWWYIRLSALCLYYFSACFAYLTSFCGQVERSVKCCHYWQTGYGKHHLTSLRTVA